MLKAADRYLMRLEYATAWLGGLTIFAVMFLVTAEVLMRRLFNNPIEGQVDFTMMSMIGFSVLCISHCYRQAGHIRMDLLQKMSGGRTSWFLELFATCCGLFLISVILPGAWTHFLRAYEFGDTTLGVGLATWPSKLAACVGLGILWVRLVLELWVYGRLLINPTLEPVGVPLPPDPLEDMDA